MPIRIAIVDDHPLAINGLTMMLSLHSEFVVSATYLTALAMIEGLKNDQPDILLLDVLLPDKAGNELVSILLKQYPFMGIIAISSLDAPAIVRSMMQQGCMGYLLKGTDQQTLIEAIQHAVRKEEFIDPALKEKLMQTMFSNKARTNVRPPLVITKREKEILRLIVNEYSTVEIAKELFISERTVETHRLAILKKLSVKNTAGMVRMALTLGLLE